MIEIVYNKEKEAAVGNEEYFRIPNNIRQIGQTPQESKIYIEDYAYTFLTSGAQDSETAGKAAILLGKCNWKDGISYLFIKSALYMENMEVTSDHISLNDTVWGSVYEDMKEYFPGQEVVGWHLSLPGNAMKITDIIYRTHLNHFGGNDKVLFLTEPQEQDEAFFLYRNGHLQKQKGYYIYYERNSTMQEYMVAKGPQESIDAKGKVQDRAVKDFRKIIAKKMERKDSDRTGQFLYVATMGVVALSLAMGAGFIRQRLEATNEMQEVSTALSEEASQTDQEEEEMLPEVTPSAQSAETAKDITTPTTTPVTIVPSETEPTPTATVTPPDIEQAETSSSISDASTTESSSNVDEISSSSPGIMDEVVSDSASGNSKETNSMVANYTIREGDTLSRISQRYYGTIGKVSEICRLNNMMEEDLIYPGQTILLP